MSEKKFYWLKLKEDFFEDDTIKWLEEQDNGKEYVLFYLKLCLKSLKSNGSMIRYVGDMLIPYDKKALAALTNTDIDTVVVAMELFKKIGLIDICETGEIYLNQLNEMVGSETTKAELMRRSRAKNKMLKGDIPVIEKKGSGNNVTGVLPKRYTEIEIEIEIENRDKETEIKREIKDQRIIPPFEVTLNDFKDMRKKMKSPMTDKAVNMLVKKLSGMAEDPDIQIQILEQSIMNGWKSIYPLKTDKVVKSYYGKKESTFNNFESREYTSEFYDSLVFNGENEDE